MPASRDSQILEVVRTRPNPDSKLIQGITHIPVPLINRRMARMRKPGILAGRMVVLAALVSSGCGRKAAPPTAQGDGDHATTATSVVAMNQPGTPGYIPPAESQVFVVNGQIDLAALTTALRDYCKWKMRVPKDLNELVTSRYLTNLPAPPAGQKYAIDPTYLEVKLVNQ